MLDAYQRELTIGDKCLYITNDGNLTIGVVEEFTPKMVVFRIGIDWKQTVTSHRLFKITEEGLPFDEIN